MLLKLFSILSLCLTTVNNLVGFTYYVLVAIIIELKYRERFLKLKSLL